MAKMTKRAKAWAGQIDREKQYDLTEAVALLKKFAGAKFDESIDVALNLNIDTRKADQQVRGMLSLPHGTGRTVRVAVFAKGDAAAAAEKAGADIVGADDLAAKVEKGFLDFDAVVATPDCMPLMGRIGKILGPKGLMPNPKLGTVTPTPEKMVKDLKSGMIEYRAEKNGVVHVMAGKVSFKEDQIRENIQKFYDTIKTGKPSGVKGVFMKGLAISSTMGPGIKVDMSTVLGDAK